jgi:ABC-2 type transport system permease protein
MTSAAAPARVLTRPAPAGSFTGTGPLLRLALRRDRVRVPVWIVFGAYLTLAVAQSWDRLYPSAESREQLAASLTADPTLSAILGPLFDPTSTGGLTAWRISAGSLLAMGLVACFLVVRHSRADEAAGRLELVGGGPVGRAAPLTAALAVAALLLLGFGLLSALMLAAYGTGVAGAFAFGLTQACAGLVFAAIAGVTAQLARTSRGANGLAGLAIGAAFLITSTGNGQQGGSPLQWVTPFGWAQQTRAYADERWWLLGLSLVVAVGVAALALHVAARRDLGAGLLAQRRGRTHAADWISGPVALAWRLDRTALLVWVLGFAVLGAVEGSMLTTSVDLVRNSPGLADVILALAGGTTNLDDAFLVTMTGLFGLLAAGFGISTALRLRAEEEDGRAELVVSAARSRTAWLSGHASTALVGSTLLLVVGGLSLGAVFGAADGDVTGQAWRAMLASLTTAPALWLVVAVPIALVGIRPAWAGVVSWLVLVWCVVASYFGAILGLPEVLQQTSPFGHVPLWPAQPMRWLPLVVLAAAALALLAAGAAGVRRRDMPR